MQHQERVQNKNLKNIENYTEEVISDITKINKLNEILKFSMDGNEIEQKMAINNLRKIYKYFILTSNN